MRLHPRHRLFVEEYLVFFNAAAAARAAGYSKKCDRATGWKLLQRPDIKRAVEEGYKRRLAAADERARTEEAARNAREPGFRPQRVKQRDRRRS